MYLLIFLFHTPVAYVLRVDFVGPQIFLCMPPTQVVVLEIAPRGPFH